MKICILGSTGLLGQALIIEGKKRNFNTIGVARSKADFCIDITDDISLSNFLVSNKFDIVINTVAIVNFNTCEENKALAYNVNARISSILTNLSQELGFKYIYISTDGYFYGDKNKKHDENTKIILLNEYARTKYIGECFTLLNSNSLVIRTNIIGFKHSTDDQTFLEWVLYSLEQQKNMLLFDDYFTSSITVAKFSNALYDLIDKNVSGILNLASSEVFSKAKFIESLANELAFSLENTSYGKVASLKSRRPDSLGLDVNKAESILEYSLPTLKESILEIKNEYIKIR